MAVLSYQIQLTIYREFTCDVQATQAADAILLAKAIQRAEAAEIIIPTLLDNTAQVFQYLELSVRRYSYAHSTESKFARALEDNNTSLTLAKTCMDNNSTCYAKLLATHTQQVIATAPSKLLAENPSSSNSNKSDGVSVDGGGSSSIAGTSTSAGSDAASGSNAQSDTSSINSSLSGTNSRTSSAANARIAVSDGGAVDGGAVKVGVSVSSASVGGAAVGSNIVGNAGVSSVSLSSTSVNSTIFVGAVVGGAVLGSASVGSSSVGSASVGSASVGGTVMSSTIADSAGGSSPGANSIIVDSTIFNSASVDSASGSSSGTSGSGTTITRPRPISKGCMFGEFNSNSVPRPPKPVAKSLWEWATG